MDFTDIISYYRRDICLLISLFIFMYTAEKRSHFPLRVISALLIYAALTTAMYFIMKFIPQSASNFSFLFINANSIAFFINHIFTIIVPIFCFKLTAIEFWTRTVANQTINMLEGIFTAMIGTPIEWFTNILGGSDLASNTVNFLISIALNILIFFAFAKKWKPLDRYSIKNGKITSICYGLLVVILYWMNIVAYTLLYSTDNNTKYYGFIVLLFLCIFTLLLLFTIQSINKQMAEKQIIEQLMHEREWQYALAKENVDIINRKCHDLKHQIQALKLVSDEDREQYYSELENSIMFYGSVATTGNEILDTILSEKTLYCESKKIMLTSVVDAESLSKIKTIDLYTLFGNAIDNAIEACEKIDDVEYRIISLNISQKNSMLCINLENYCDEMPEFSGNDPITTKKDKRYHGFGIKSIKTIVKKYNGEVIMSCKDNIFTLFIAIPV